MAVRNLAIQLYEAIKKVEELEKLLMQVEPDGRNAVEIQLKAARRERDRLKKVLDAKKSG
jgi:hypothetical protein